MGRLRPNVPNRTRQRISAGGLPAFGEMPYAGANGDAYRNTDRDIVQSRTKSSPNTNADCNSQSHRSILLSGYGYSLVGVTNVRVMLR